MTIREMRSLLGDTQSEFSNRYGIPFRTLQNWESGVRTPPEYLIRLLEEKVKSDAVNRKTYVLPSYDPKKKQLPRLKDYVGTLSWLKALKESLGEDFVFALDEALMCSQLYTGLDDLFLVFGYGNNSLRHFNGVVLLGNGISSNCIEEKDGIRYTSFSRTVTDFLANEEILDMQPVTEALSMYYFTHGETFEGIHVPPRYQERFDLLAKEAADYYSN